MAVVASKVGVIIVNWNTWRDTIECVESVRRSEYPNFSIYVVDNGSTDNSEHQLRAWNPELRVIQAGSNLGWAGGNNVGIRAALADGCEHVFLLNSDALVCPNTLIGLVEASHLPHAAALGSLILSASTPTWVEYGGSTIDPESHFPHHLLGEAGEVIHETSPVPTAVVKGCSMLLTRSALEDVGLLEEEYFLNYDETDWCYRACASGLLNYVVPAAVTYHKGAVSFQGTANPLYRYFIIRNRLLFARRHLDRKGQRFAWRLALWEFKQALFLSQPSNYSATRHRLLLLFALCLGLLDYCMSRFGDCPRIVRSLNQLYLGRENTFRPS